MESFYDEEKGLEKCWNELEKCHNNYRKEIEEKYKNSELVHEEIWGLCPWEQESIMFSIENISLIENMYYYKHNLTFWKDFPECHFKK